MAGAFGMLGARVADQNVFLPGTGRKLGRNRGTCHKKMWKNAASQGRAGGPKEKTEMGGGRGMKEENRRRRRRLQ